jgi:hypothetical protein
MGLRAQAIKAGEPGLSIRVDDLVLAIPMPYEPEPLPVDATPEEVTEANREPLEFADDMLTRYGIRSRPSLTQAGSGGVVVLRPTRRYALQGSIGLGVLAVVTSAVASKIAAAVYVPFVIMGAALIWWQFPRLDRLTPKFVPRGRIIGALAMVVVLALATVIAVQPARNWATQRGIQQNAKNLAAQANAALESGNYLLALQSADLAMKTDPSLPEVQSSNEKAQAAGLKIVEQAKAQQAAGEWKAALATLATLQTFFDAPELIEQYKREDAAALKADALDALNAGKPRLAFRLYARALTFDESARDANLIKEIGRALQAGS